MPQSITPPSSRIISKSGSNPPSASPPHRLLALLFFLLLATATPAFALTVSLPNTTAPADSAIVLPLTVTDFNNIGAITFKIQFDHTILRYTGLTTSIQRFSPPPLSSATPQGLLSIVWVDFTGRTPLNAGNTVLLSLKFDVLGNPGSSTDLVFTAENELATGTGQVIPGVVYHNGKVTVPGGEPGFTLSSPALEFGNVEKGQSASRELHITSTGVAPLIITSLSLNGEGFTYAPSLSPGHTLPPGKTDTLRFTFAPATTGSRTATLTISHNAASSPHTVSLSGSGIDTTPPSVPAAPLARTEPGRILLSLTPVADTDLSHYTLYRSQTAGTQGDSIGAVIPPETVFIQEELDPGTYYYRTRAVDLSGNRSESSAPASATLAPALAVSPDTLDLEIATVGNTVQRTIPVRNTGNATLTISSIALSGPNADAFAVSPVALTLPPEADPDTLTITFTPASEGPKTATLSLSHNAPESSTEIILTGTGRLPPPGPAPALTLSATRLDFGTVSPGEQAERTLGISNTGTADLRITGIATSAPAFTAPPDTFTVSAGQTRTLTVRFAPTERRNHTATLTLTHNDSSRAIPARISLSGLGAAPDLALSATALDFGQVLLGQTASLPIQISNAGNLNLHVSVAGVSDPVFAASPDSLTIGAIPHSLDISFTPATPGRVSATLTLSTSDPDERTRTVSLTGEGIAPAPADSPRVLSETLAFDPVRQDSSATDTLRLFNPTANVVAGRALISGSGFSLPRSPFPIELAPGDTLRIPVVFSPPDTGIFTARLTITLQNREISATLTGTGLPIPLPPPSPPCPDFDGSGRIDFPDFLLFAAHYGRRQNNPAFDARFDLDGSGQIDFPDFLTFAATFGTTCS